MFLKKQIRDKESQERYGFASTAPPSARGGRPLCAGRGGLGFRRDNSVKQKIFFRGLTSRWCQLALIYQVGISAARTPPFLGVG